MAARRPGLCLPAPLTPWLRVQPRLSRHPLGPSRRRPAYLPGASPAPPPQRGAPGSRPGRARLQARTLSSASAFPCLGLPRGPTRPPWSASALSRPLPAFLSLRLGRQVSQPPQSFGAPSGDEIGLLPSSLPGLPFPRLTPFFPPILGPLSISLALPAPTPTRAPCVPGFLPFAPKCFPFPTRPFSLRFHHPPSLTHLFLYA